MALVTVNGVSVISGNITMPLVGVWTADLVIDQVDGTGFSAGTSVTITSENGFSIKGTVAPARTGDFLDAVHVRVLGGAGGMSNTTNPRAFIQPGAFVRDVVNALCSDGSETLSTTSNQGFLTTSLTAWTMIQRSVSQSLQILIDNVSPGLSWRFLSDGTLWIGSETWPSDSNTYDSLVYNPIDQSWDFGVEAPTLMPGSSVPNVGNINRVVHEIADGKVRTKAYVDIPGQQRGPLGAIKSMVFSVFSGIDFYAFYDCKMVAQSADLSTVDIQPNDGRLPGMQRITLRLGTPGVKAQVAPGATLRLGWDGGDPSQPFACLWNGDASALAVNVKATQVDINGTASATVESSGTTAIKGSTVTLGNNVVRTPVLTVGSVDSLGVPVSPSPTSTGTVLSG